jgi:hypothetical protein
MTQLWPQPLEGPEGSQALIYHLTHVIRQSHVRAALLIARYYRNLEVESSKTPQGLQALQKLFKETLVPWIRNQGLQLMILDMTELLWQLNHECRVTETWFDEAIQTWVIEAAMQSLSAAPWEDEVEVYLSQLQQYSQIRLAIQQEAQPGRRRCLIKALDLVKSWLSLQCPEDYRQLRFLEFLDPISLLVCKEPSFTA